MATTPTMHSARVAAGALASATCAGRKHAHTPNEDATASFSLRAARDRTLHVAALLDGHGPHRDDAVPPGAAVAARAAHALPGVLAWLAALHDRCDPHDAAWAEWDADPADDGKYAAVLALQMTTLRDALSRALDPQLARDAGCTLCVAVRVGAHLVCASVGDSTMVLLPRADRAPLRCWAGQVRSFRDSVTHWPHLLEGQPRDRVRRDYEHVRPRLRERGGGHVLAAPHSRHVLRMVNSVGNLAHASAFVPRGGSVYVHRNVPAGIVLVMCSDGITDTMPTAAGLADTLHDVVLGTAETAVTRLDAWTSLYLAARSAHKKGAHRSRSSSISSAAEPNSLTTAAMRLAKAVRCVDSAAREHAAQLMNALAPDASMPERLACTLVSLAILRGSRDDVTALAWDLDYQLPDPAGPEMVHHVQCAASVEGPVEE